MRGRFAKLSVGVAALLSVVGCATPRMTYVDQRMDFASIRSVAVMPFWNLTQEGAASDRVRTVFSNALLATDAVYVLPPGEVVRAVSRSGVASPSTPSVEEVVKLGTLLKVDAIVTGVVKEYGEVRSGSAAANVISVSIQMHEATTGKVVWSASATRGGIGWWARLLGTAGGEPMNSLTERAIDDVLDQLFR